MAKITVAIPAFQEKTKNTAIINSAPIMPNVLFRTKVLGSFDSTPPDQEFLPNRKAINNITANDIRK